MMGLATSGAVEVRLVGDQSVLVRFPGGLSENTVRMVWAAQEALDSASQPWLVDVVSAYASLLVVYDPVAVEGENVLAWVQACLGCAGHEERARRQLAVPVWYDPEVGLDLEDVARLTGLTVGEVVRRHVEREVLVFMLGFKPGFPYMAEVDASLRVSRLPSPRPRVPGGSVALAGRQTGIYPGASPGGWRIIGRTPWRLFDPGRAEPFRVRAGDAVRFVPVDRARFFELLAEEESR